MQSFLQDLRYGFRTLMKARGFTAVAVLSIAIGIAACAVVFTWFKAAFLNPVPGARDPRQLVTMTVRTADCGGCSNSYPEYLYVREHARTLDGVIAYDLIPLNI